MSEKNVVETRRINAFGNSVEISGYSGDYVFEQIRRHETFYERDLLDLLASINVKNGLLVDVGANLGNHTLFLALAYPGLRVVAVEPFEKNLELLRRNVEQNGLNDRVDVVDVPWSGSSREYSLLQRIEGNLGTISLSEPATDRPTVISGTMDDHVAGRPVAIVKIDVEGHETQVLRGASRTLEASHPVVVTEAHDPVALREIEEMLVPLGYEAVAVRGRSRNFVWLAAGETLGADEVRAITRRAGVETMVLERSDVARGFDTVYRRIDESRKGGVTAEEVRSAVDASLSEARTADGAWRDRMESGFVEELELHRRVEDHMAGDLEWRQTMESQLEALVAGQKQADTERRAEVKTWQAAYQSLSRLTGDLAPEVWTHVEMDGEVAATRSRAREGVDGPRDVTPQRDRDRVRVGIATMPGREEGLAAVLASLHAQADEIFVYLNGYERPADSLPAYTNVTYLTGEDLGDRGKFVALEGFSGYYLTCDDDIAYPKFYVDHIVAGIERHGRRRAVAWHGSVFKAPFDNYYDPSCRRVFAFYAHRPGDTPVHLVGTGVTGFHTSTIQFAMADMPVANMADVWFAIRAREQSVGLTVLAHERDWAKPLDKEAASISNSSLGRRDTEAALDMRAIVTDEVATRMPWPQLDGPAPAPKAQLRLGIIGRTDRARWKKGGILKSCHLMAETLRRFGAETELADIETGDPTGFGGFEPNVVMIYVGDPNRPDYAKVDEYIAHHAALGRALIVNMSLEGHQERTEWIRDRLLYWRGVYPGQVYAMVFTNAAKHLPEFAAVQDQIVVIPKTIETLAPEPVTFEGTEGVFVGDVAKLVDPRIIEGDIHEWLGALRKALPGVPLYAVQQYKPKYDVDLGIDHVWPFMKDDMSQKMSSMRMMVSFAANLTFEMVPLEVASLGVPVVHRVMPHSLSEYFGVSALEVGTPSDLAALVGEVYHNPLVWRSFSDAGAHRARSLRLGSTSGYFYVQLLRIAKSVAR
ncbi:FkbM family methyltransferase [Promicromonospora kroppenstedtii]|uniref:FkbM family methyltransferase n=1 Tax=Promicromonospora kroppenstedtii TaxID=440482 RepID=UPI00055C7EAE|nr:FkbM family methyltransferase [Promicromonospora kroppenstedtii]